MTDDQEQDHTKFNVNNLLTFTSKDKEHTLTFSAYNGSIQLTMGDGKFEPGRKPRSLVLNLHMAEVLKENIRKIIEHPEPGRKYTMTYNGFWNAEAKRRELSCTITVGLSDSAIAYIGIKHLHPQTKEVWNGLFELAGDRYLEVMGEYDDDKSRSFTTLRMLYDLLQSSYFHNASLLTRNYLATRKPQQKALSSDIVDY